MKLALWDVLCAALFWSVFCRSVRADTTTKLTVRLAIFGAGLASLLGLGAPMYGWEPDVVVSAIVAAIVFMQVVMAQHWHHGVPRQFIADRYKPLRRASDPFK